MTHECEGELVLTLTNKKVPYFNSYIFLESKAAVGKVEEIFGSINDVVRDLYQIFMQYMR